MNENTQTALLPALKGPNTIAGGIAPGNRVSFPATPLGGVAETRPAGYDPAQRGRTIPQGGTGYRGRRPARRDLPPAMAFIPCGDSPAFGRVEGGRGYSRQALPRFPAPLIEPDVRISRIRLSD